MTARGSGAPDVRALTSGALVSVLVAVPVASIGAAVLDDGSTDAIAFGAVALAGFLAGGWVAGWRQPGAPLRHGALAALLGFAVAQAVVLVLRAVGDDTVSAASVAVNALLATSVGLAGGWLAALRPPGSRSDG